ncbi:MAG TPA: YolD-like family protein [Acholeplasmataceae bacterium]|jgi:hypothetical protein|nr:YolD-like family protein [Acholeplasmataceae bacterium]
MPSKERNGKWQPFDALEGFRAAIKATEREKAKIPKPELLPDAVTEIDQALRWALENGAEAEITYYHDGAICRIAGVVTKIDVIARSVSVGRKRVDLDAIVGVKTNNDERELCE